MGQRRSRTHFYLETNPLLENSKEISNFTYSVEYSSLSFEGKKR